jgi:signal transduction histidine kinase
VDGGLAGVRLEVIDRGVGIPLDQQQRVFERYYQVDAARTPGQPRRGTGLGLAIVKHAVRRLGGTVRVQSLWQQGTTMIVELPGCVEE